jgi:hypothetical protein
MKRPAGGSASRHEVGGLMTTDSAGEQAGRIRASGKEGGARAHLRSRKPGSSQIFRQVRAPAGASAPLPAPAPPGAGNPAAGSAGCRSGARQPDGRTRSPSGQRARRSQVHGGPDGQPTAEAGVCRVDVLPSRVPRVPPSAPGPGFVRPQPGASGPFSGRDWLTHAPELNPPRARP